MNLLFYPEATRVKIAVHGPKIRIIQRVVAQYYGIEVKDMQAHRRNRQSVYARQRVHYFAREFSPQCPLEIIGIVTGNGKAYDHCTIIHSCKKITGEMNFTNKAGEYVYQDTRDEINELRSKIKAEIVNSKEEIVERCKHCGQVIRK